MIVILRMFFRMVRLRNLLTLTLLIILLYMLSFQHNRSRSASSELPKIFVPISLKKIDWHNVTLIEIDRSRTGIGEHGVPAYVQENEIHLEKSLYDANGFNGYLSDKISLNRSLPDIRHPHCHNMRYLEALPSVSVVVPFHNEHWSTLLRTATSVLNRSPPHLLKEIFLVDDASTKAFLKKDLDVYVAKYMPKVKVVRLEKRSGLIAARLAGAANATADVLVFLDSHTEANVNWLPPLLEPIALNYRTAVCPFIDVINFDTFEYTAQDEGARGAFDWEFFYKRLPVTPNDKANMPKPFESPAMAGGLFAISRAFFEELGGYDPGLDIWGGEQYELSFKIWQCGGRMLDAPCSRVGHIYRKFTPFPNPNHGDFVGKNYRRVAEVWMDEYAEFLYQRRPQYRDIDPGDLSERRAIRKRLHCKPFKWFITQIAFDLTYKYPTVEPKPFAEGKIRPYSEYPHMCVLAHAAALAARACALPALEGRFVFSWHKDIRLSQRNMCWDLPDSAPGSRVRLYNCHLSGGNQLWQYNPDTKQIIHGTSCLEYEPGSSPHTLDLYMDQCDESEKRQRWAVDFVYRDRLSTWHDERPWPTGPPNDPFKYKH